VGRASVGGGQMITLYPDQQDLIDRLRLAMRIDPRT